MTNISVNQVNIPDLNIDFVRSLPRVEFLNRRELPFDKGLYFVCVDYPVFQVLYIGCTTSFRARWDRHNKQEEFKVLQVVQPVWIYYLAMNWQKEDMEILEYAAIRKLSPSLNVRGIDNDIFIVSRISKNEKELILSEISKPLEDYSSEELVVILERLGISLIDNSKPKYWMIGAIKKSLYGMDEFSCKIEANFSEKRKQVALNKSSRKVSRIPKAKEALVDVDLSVAKNIDPRIPDSYSEVTIRTMKKLASMLNVCGYSVMTKDELAHKISLAAKRLDPLR
jgi:hypothetical protein